MNDSSDLNKSDDAVSVSPLLDDIFYPPCTATCPAHINVQGYVSLISQGRFQESLDLIRKSIPFPAVCGRVCFSPCEESCYRGRVDEPISIRLLKRLVSETDYAAELLSSAKPVKLTQKEKVAVIGSGPAGLTAAYELVKMGYSTTVYERDAQVGGMLRTHIPRYRLPEDVIDAEIKYIQDLGVKFETGKEIKSKDFDKLKEEYDAVFVSVGAQQSYKLNIPGEDLEGVYFAIQMMWDHYQGQKIEMPKKVAVIGGGNVAIDSARTALRLGAKEVVLVYRRSINEMPATKEEIEQALEEGIKYQELTNPSKIVGKDGKVTGLECVTMTLGEPDESGRRRPIPVPNSEYVIDFDAVIIAIGQSIDLSFIPKEAVSSRWGTLIVSDESLRTNIEKVFGGGDCVTGPSSVIEAIASGVRGAKAIDNYLRGKHPEELREKSYKEKVWLNENTDVKLKPRNKPRYLSPKRRSSNFDEVEYSFSAEEGITESLRCLHCGPCDVCLEKEDYCMIDKAVVESSECSGCGVCITVCPFNAVSKDELGLAVIDEGNCKGCGICAASCPDKAISMKTLSDACIFGEIKSGGN